MQSKKVSFLPKIFIHIVAISFFLFGFVILHAVYNDTSDYDYMLFFAIPIGKVTIFDMGLLFFGMGFFIEFLFTFKPIYVLTKKR